MNPYICYEEFKELLLDHLNSYLNGNAEIRSNQIITANSDADKFLSYFRKDLVKKQFVVSNSLRCLFDVQDFKYYFQSKHRIIVLPKDEYLIIYGNKIFTEMAFNCLIKYDESYSYSYGVMSNEETDHLRELCTKENISMNFYLDVMTKKLLLQILENFDDIDLVNITMNRKGLNERIIIKTDPVGFSSPTKTRQILQNVTDIVDVCSPDVQTEEKSNDDIIEIFVPDEQKHADLIAVNRSCKNRKRQQIDMSNDVEILRFCPSKKWQMAAVSDIGMWNFHRRNKEPIEETTSERQQETNSIESATMINISEDSRQFDTWEISDQSCGRQVTENPQTSNNLDIYVIDSSSDDDPVPDDLEENRTVELKETNKKDSNLRPVIIDATNIAFSYGCGKFNAKGIEIAIKYFLQRGHNEVYALIPRHRQPEGGNMFDNLEKAKHLIYTPSRIVNNKRETSYDDKLILEAAYGHNGVVISNDQFRDLLNIKKYTDIIVNRLIPYTFVGDLFIIPDDPKGLLGPHLSTILSNNSVLRSSMKSNQSVFKQRRKKFRKLRTVPRAIPRNLKTQHRRRTIIRHS